MKETQKTAAELVAELPALQKNAQGQLTGGFTLLGGILGPLEEIFGGTGAGHNTNCFSYCPINRP